MTTSESGEFREAYYPVISSGHGVRVTNLHSVYELTCYSTEVNSSYKDHHVVADDHNLVATYGTTKTVLKTGTLMT